MKVLLEYDETTGIITDASNMLVGTLMGVKSFDQSINVAELIKLGVTPDEIIKMKNQDLFN